MKIPLFGYEILKSGTVSEIKKSVEELQTTAKLRPLQDFTMYREQNGAMVPQYATDLKKSDMMQLAKLSSVYRQVVSALQWQLFRRGGEFKPLFKSKCTSINCQKEFEYETENCDECGSITRKPDQKQMLRPKQFFEKCNENGQKIIDVCRETEFDVDVVDDLFIAIAMEYVFDSQTGEISLGAIKEAFRIDPDKIGFMADKTHRIGYNQEGKPVFFCPEHRDKLLVEKQKCPICGKKAYPAYYKTKGPDDNDIYYMDMEIIHTSKFNPSLLGGYPPFLSLYQKVMIELNMDWHIKKSYEKGRPPNGWIFVKTKNRDSLQKAIDWTQEQLKINPHFLSPIGVDSEKGGSFVEYVNLLNSMQEMQATEFRDTIKREIGALFGVMPLFQGDASVGGGLNNEGLQITVTNRAVEVGQEIYNQNVFPKLLKLFGVTDWKYELLPSEEKDEMAELQREQLKEQNAKLMQDMGFEVTRNESGEFVYSNEPVNKPNSGMPENSFGLQPTFGGQRFSGEPESTRKSIGKANSLKKPVKQAAQQAKETQKTLEEELQETIKELNFKRKASKEQIRRAVEKIIKKFGDKIETATKKELESAYKKAMGEVEKEAQINLFFGERDKNAIEVLAHSRPLTEAYSGMTASLSKKINDVITKAYEEPELFSLDRMVTAMKKEADDEEYRLRRIARTETTKVSNIARMNSFLQADPEGKNLYKWIGPEDDRTTPICKEIAEKTKHGVSLVELKRIVHETAKAHDPNFEPCDFLPHINCRHVFVRVF